MNQQSSHPPTPTTRSQRFFATAAPAATSIFRRFINLHRTGFPLMRHTFIIMLGTTIASAIFLIRQASTGNFQSVFPFAEPKFSLDRHHPLIHRLTSHKDLILKASIPGLIQRADAISEASDLKEIDLQLEKCKTIMVGGLYSDQDLIGVLMLGGKGWWTASLRARLELYFTYLGRGFPGTGVDCA